MARAKFERNKPHVNIGTVGHVDHGDTGLTDQLQHALPDHAARLAQVAAVERFHVLDAQSAVVEREQRRFGADLGDGFIGKPSELDHVHTHNVCVSHGVAPVQAIALKKNER